MYLCEEEGNLTGRKWVYDVDLIMEVNERKPGVEGIVILHLKINF